MTSKQRKLRRLQLDSRLERIVEYPPRPIGGWVQAIREALGMSLDSFGSRLGVSRQSAHQLEAAEVTETITIKRLRAAAEALDCELMICLKPKNTLQESVRQHAERASQILVARTQQSMALEDQAVSSSYAQNLVLETASDLIEKGDQRIWKNS